MFATGIAVAVAMTPLSASAASSTLMNATVPLEVSSSNPPAVADQRGDAFLFTGQVFRFDAHTDTSGYTSGRLPNSQGKTAAAAWDPALQRAFLFGGATCTSTGCDTADQISSYDPATDSATVMGARLPQPIAFASAAYVGGFIYIFGGALPTCCPYTDQIVRYDPVNDAISVMNATLPSPRINMSEAVFGSSVYLFGGCCTFTEDTGGYNEIVRYDTLTDTTQLMSARLPTGRYYTSAARLGNSMYIFGGTSGGFKDLSLDAYYSDIVRYNPAADTASISPVALPSGRAFTAAVAISNRAYVFGGFSADPSGQHYYPDIVRFDPSGP
jgi:N-acetylneuraminic acid mutarotase